MKKIDKSANVLGHTFFSKRKLELLNQIENSLKEATDPYVIFTPNPEHLMITREKPGFGQVLERADVRVPDGVSIVLASRILSWMGKSAPIAERIPGVELVENVLQMAAEKKWSVLIVGGRGYHNRSLKNTSSNWIIQKYSATTQAQVQPLTALPLWWLEAYGDAANPTVKEEIDLKKQLAELKPDVILVALGAPLQEEWIMTHYETLRDNKVRIAMVVGGAFDMLTGMTPRAPLVYRKVGFEWLYRLWQQPWRWRRQLRLVRFVFELLKQILIPR